MESLRRATTRIGLRIMIAFAGSRMMRKSGTGKKYGRVSAMAHWTGRELKPKINNPSREKAKKGTDLD